MCKRAGGVSGMVEIDRRISKLANGRSPLVPKRNGARRCLVSLVGCLTVILTRDCQWCNTQNVTPPSRECDLILHGCLLCAQNNLQCNINRNRVGRCAEVITLIGFCKRITCFLHFPTKNLFSQPEHVESSNFYSQSNIPRTSEHHYRSPRLLITKIALLNHLGTY